MDKDKKDAEKQDQELDEKELESVAGGLLRAGGNDDLDELEVERKK
jgi:bacteriocin-like protein